ncbi:ATP/GTP-binding protein [Streptomyces sp. WAC 00631]|uniref:GTP-binding protein n=1 Tax=Streptomyces sp. WAC 00631 TaxID=2203201 RepID=UPI001E2FE545|nr:ATP/GTP-binding protein [Streptomyces sp. WAC 00631]MCC5035105.1 ATP/GTP-binding protein [Streptomyces sp. WAC 00631]
MDSTTRFRNPGTHLACGVFTALKIAVLGPFAVGKTTFVGTLSEIPPLRTEEVMTRASVGVDDLAAAPGKTTTTVALDFGRLTLDEQTVLYLFGAPGQGRFEQVWEDLLTGALGALVLADTRRLEASYSFMDLLERYGIPYAVAVNEFDHAPRHEADALRAAMDLDERTPLTLCDARDRVSSTRALITLTEYLLSLEPA